MNWFDIYFLSDAPGIEISGCHTGEICIDSFREAFASDVTFWPRSRYEQQWLDAALRITTGDRAAMIISLGDPSSSNFIRWWALYRDGDSLAIQEQIFFLEELRDPFDPEKVDQYVRPRESTSEDGEPISEWFTTVAAVLDFLKRRSLRL